MIEESPRNQTGNETALERLHELRARVPHKSYVFIEKYCNFAPWKILFI